jgi:hypothetical protein
MYLKKAPRANFVLGVDLVLDEEDMKDCGFCFDIAPGGGMLDSSSCFGNSGAVSISNFDFDSVMVLMIF